MSNVPDGAQLSDDGQWYWDSDSNEWKAVEGGSGESGGAPAPGTSPSEGAGGTAEPTEEELRAVGDTGAEPGDADKAGTEKLKPYFQQETGDEDSSYGDAGEVLDDSQFTGEGESSETESQGS
ncbi:MAG TPA: hypothetical protein VF855_04325 [Acidimicrobiales bacterium]